jgi:hypothetical protein
LNFYSSRVYIPVMTLNYNKLNTITGWAVFAAAAVTYLSTMETTASLWDCGEYIASCYKLEVGHPPGAPFFILIGRLFTLLAGDDPTRVAMWVNIMSAMCSAFTILLLFWCITALAKKLTGDQPDNQKIIAILGSGAVGALAYTFSDSFWFSAVEGEVYAMSSLFTALVFWAALRWEQAADSPRAERWIILIALLVGISIGVHLLNLLAIPALVFIYYFKKYKPSRKGIIYTGIISILLLGGIQAGIIPWIVKLAAMSELLFVNSIGLPFNSGTIVYILLLIGAIVYGLRYTHRKQLVKWNTALLCFTMILIGYSSFLVLIIRSQANTPMDQNNPENAINLLSYLNRDQYGNWPILHGHYYNSPLDKKEPYRDGSPVYRKDHASGKYIVIDDGRNSEPNYDPAFCTVFPRMWSQQASHESGYKQWGNIKGERKQYVNLRGERETIVKPKFSENLAYFFSYQVNFMYLRYFMWNFVGRQNDMQGHGNASDGNWITGISFIDEWRLGQQDHVTHDMESNKGRNVFYGLPFLLGIIGAVYQFKKRKNDMLVVLLLFIFTGLAIVVYINQHPLQPRERDYSYAGSFFAFAVWIGLGVYAIADIFRKRIRSAAAAAGVAIACLLLVPGIMAKEGWDDHDRTGNRIAADIAYNYLNSCAPNAILFTHGDNDTFPLWYAQEVEGIRTDVRVIVLSYFNMDWYIDQMRRRVYKSDPVPFNIDHEKNKTGTRDYIPVIERSKEPMNIKDLMAFITSDEPQDKLELGDGKLHNYLPTRKVRIPVNREKVLKNKVVPAEMTDSIAPYIEFELPGNYISKSTMMILDLLANNNWERPIYFGVSGGQDAFIGLMDYFQLGGMAYRFVPVKNNTQRMRVSTEVMYDKVMNDFRWGNLHRPGMFVNDVTQKTIAGNLRIQVSTLAAALITEGKKEKAVQALDRCLEKLPHENIPYDGMLFNLIINYYEAGAVQKANDLTEKLFGILSGNLEYYYLLPASLRPAHASEKKQTEDLLQRLAYAAEFFGQEQLAKNLQQRLSNLLKNHKKLPAPQ